MEKIRNSILAGLAFGILFGVFLAVLFGINYALIAGPISGFAFGIMLYFFLASKTVNRQTQIQTADGEKVIHSGGTNHFINGELVENSIFCQTNFNSNLTVLIFKITDKQ